MAWNFTIAGQNYRVFVTQIEKDITPNVFVQNPVSSSESGSQSSITVVSTGTPSQRITVRGRMLLGTTSSVTATYGPYNPGSSIQSSIGSGLSNWNSISNILTDNGNVATSAPWSLDPVYAPSSFGLQFPLYPRASQLLVGYNFGFAIPTTSTITGISAAIKLAESQSLGMDNVVSLVTISNSIAFTLGTNKSTTGVWPLTLTYKNYGSTTDLWGSGLTPSIANSSSFGLGISGVFRTQNATLQVDTMALTITATSLLTSVITDAFSAAVKDKLAVTMVDDKSVSTSVYITKFQSGRIQTVKTDKYVDVTISMIKAS